MQRVNALLCRLMLMAACLFGITAAAGACLHVPALGWLALAGLVWRRYRQGSGGSGWTHGTAREATLEDAARCGLLAQDGLILGRASLLSPPTRLRAMWLLFSPGLSSELACSLFLTAFLGAGGLSGRMIRIRSYVHLATFAPAGAGKGVSVVIPNLLSYPNSTVVTDTKGELFRLTARPRMKKLGNRVFVLDPLGVTGPPEQSAGLNPLDFIDEKALDFLDQCRDLANMIVVRTGKETDPHWNDSAQIVICALITFVCAMERDPGKRNLATVRKILSSRACFTQAVAVMQQIDACQQVIAREGGKLSWFQGEELGSVQTTVQRHMEFLDSPAIGRHVSRSTFDPRLLVTGKATIYLCLPEEKLDSLAPLQRLWIGTLLKVIQRQKAGERHPVLWMLDEVGHIGHVAALEQAVTLGRGSGIRLWFIFQDHDQIRKCFGDNAPTVLGNLGTQQYFGLTSFETAEAVSKRIGDTTIRVASEGSNSGNSYETGPRQGSSNRSRGHSSTWSDTGRRLYKPEEILSLAPDVALVLHRNHPVVAACLVKYYNAPEFRRRWTGSYGTGRQRGLGLAAMVMATAALLFAAGLADVVSRLPIPARMPVPVAQPRPTGGRSLPYAHPAPQPVPRPVYRPGTPYRRVPYRSGH